MVRVLVGALVGGVALFVWSFSAWMYLGIHDLDAAPKLTNEDGVIEALEGEQRGVYWIPGASMDHQPDSPEYKAWEEKYERGPRGFLVFDPEGGEAMSTTTMAIGLVVNILIGLIVALMLRGLGIRSFTKRFLLVLGIGVIVTLVMDVQNWNWQGFPDDWTRGFIIDHVGGMAIMGFLMAMIVKPGPKPE